MNSSDFQRWAALSHASYEQNRDAVATAPACYRDAFLRRASEYARSRASDFKHSWRLRFGTHEPEAWA